MRRKVLTACLLLSQILHASASPSAVIVSCGSDKGAKRHSCEVLKRGFFLLPLLCVRCILGHGRGRTLKCRCEHFVTSVTLPTLHMLASPLLPKTHMASSLLPLGHLFLGYFSLAPSSGYLLAQGNYITVPAFVFVFTFGCSRRRNITDNFSQMHSL